MIEATITHLSPNLQFINWMVPSNERNPDIAVRRGVVHYFEARGAEHPLFIRASSGGANVGLTGNAGGNEGVAVGTVSLFAPTGPRGLLSWVYQCSNHVTMVGNLYIVDEGPSQCESFLLTEPQFLQSLQREQLPMLSTAS